MFDINTPLENPVLKSLFEKRRNNPSEEQLPIIFDELIKEIAFNAKFLSVVQIDDVPLDDKSVILNKNSKIEFPMLVTQDNKYYYPVFIDWEELSKNDHMKKLSPETLILTFDDYAAMVLNNNKAEGIIINPYSDSMVIDRDLMIQIQFTVEKDTPVQLGAPANYPTDMVKSIIKYAKKHKEIETLWLQLMKKENEFSFLIVVDCTSNIQENFDGISDSSQSFLTNKYLDLVSYSDSFGIDAVKGVKPFYKKKSFPYIF